MPELCRRVWRAAPSPPPQIVSKILQRVSHALIAEQGCAGFARCPCGWPHSLPAHPGRIAPSIRRDLISGRDRYSERLYPALSMVSVVLKVLTVIRRETL